MAGYNLKEVMSKPERLAPGHRMCAGCGATIGIRAVLRALHEGDRAVIGNATGCLEVSSFMYPYTAWEDSYIHNAFENAGATLSGAETAYRALKKRGRIPEDVNYKFITFGGDGGTYDIGFQALSGMAERGQQLMYVCFNNEAYMNTGIQRSGATGFGASTTTSPAGTVQQGKTEYPKDLTMIMAAHDIPYVAQVSPHNWRDLISKCEKGFECGGPAFINAVSPCPRGWRFASDETINMAKLSVETCVWPLYEVDNGKYNLTAESLKIANGVAEKKPVTEWFKAQGRYKHMLKPENADLVKQVQEEIDRKWDRLLKLSKL
jgi:pyruvate ferredoxin oxidoreductase beta subunit